MEQQLLLGAQLVPNLKFDNYFVGSNQVVVEVLQHSLQAEGEPYVYLWGEVGCGVSHLLQAVCHQAHANKQRASYFPLQQVQRFGPEVLTGIEQYDIVCIDDIDCIAGHAAWEEALFHVYNVLREKKRRLLIGAHAPPKSIDFNLADLVSRLCWGLTCQIQTLTDTEKAEALQFAAQIRGFSLPEPVAQFLLTHCARSQGKLFNILAQLDEASLVAKRKLTIPFVKQILDL